MSKKKKEPKPRKTVAILLVCPRTPCLVIGWPEKSASRGEDTITPPQGGVQEWETPIQAAIREVQEELRIILEPEQIIELRHKSFLFETRGVLKEYVWVLARTNECCKLSPSDEMRESWWLSFEQVSARASGLADSKKIMLAEILDLVLALKDGPFQGGIRNRAYSLARSLRSTLVAKPKG